MDYALTSKDVRPVPDAWAQAGERIMERKSRFDGGEKAYTMDFLGCSDFGTRDESDPAFPRRQFSRRAVLRCVVVCQYDQVEAVEFGHPYEIERVHFIGAAGGKAGMEVQICIYHK